MTTPQPEPPEPTREPTVRDLAPQYVLPLVVRIERDSPPQRTDALETAARAVLTFLDDPRSTDPDGEWRPLVEAWTDGRIRKVVRRARGAEWRRAAELPGITVSGAGAGDCSGDRAEAAEAEAGEAAGPPGPAEPAEPAEPAGPAEPAEVRVYPPIPLDAWPKDLAKLQVSGTELDDDPAPGPVPDGVPVLWLNPGLEMSAGKAMAQVGHAAQIGWWELDDKQRRAWAESGFRLAVRTATSATWPLLADGSLPLVRDAGFTEIAPGSSTVVADLRALDR